jgi:uncharacterized glyoxalase superfamily protein PhnB
MSRFHVHVSVDDLEANIRFYSAVFGTAPSVTKEDYAKWMVEDPRVSFAISQRGREAGLNHLGIQVDSDAELDAMRTRLAEAAIGSTTPVETACCYARSNKYWTTDPQGIAWETFHTLGGTPIFGEEDVAKSAAKRAANACCVASDAPGTGKQGVDSAVAQLSACCAK